MENSSLGVGPSALAKSFSHPCLSCCPSRVLRHLSCYSVLCLLKLAHSIYLNIDSKKGNSVSVLKLISKLWEPLSILRKCLKLGVGVGGPIQTFSELAGKLLACRLHSTFSNSTSLPQNTATSFKKQGQSHLTLQGDAVAHQSS